MGVDISGRNPIIRSSQPESPDWKTATKEEKDTYFEVSNKWEAENPGYYFALNWWSWRPIHMVCEHANQQHNLKMNMSKWGNNDGAGLRTQKQCDRLANALDEFINSPNSPMVEDSDMIYICFGSWVDSKNQFLNKETIDELGLNDQYEYSEIIHGGVVTNGGEIYYPSHGCSKLTLKRFISFLKECGGFKIY
jgi:hypothetical protein